MDTIKVMIEIPHGSKTKYELDKESGKIITDRFLHVAMYFPFNYGFVPDTLAEDGDPTDILVLSMNKINSGSMAEVQVIGMLEMEDEAGIDTKIVAVPPVKVDPLYGNYNSIDDIPDAIKNMIKHFFEHYKDLEKEKWVKVGRWLGSKEAKTALSEDIARAKK